MVEVLRRIRSWLTAPARVPVRVIDDAHVDLDDVDEVSPPVRYVELGKVDDWVLDGWRERFRSSRLIWLPPPVEVACVFCPEKATDEIFVGWATSPTGVDGPPMAQFARVCINHVGRSRFTRSGRPVDEL